MFHLNSFRLMHCKILQYIFYFQLSNNGWKMCCSHFGMYAKRLMETIRQGHSTTILFQVYVLSLKKNQDIRTQ